MRLLLERGDGHVEVSDEELEGSGFPLLLIQLDIEEPFVQNIPNCGFQNAVAQNGLLSSEDALILRFRGDLWTTFEQRIIFDHLARQQGSTVIIHIHSDDRIIERHLHFSSVVKVAVGELCVHREFTRVFKYCFVQNLSEVLVDGFGDNLFA